MGKTTAQIEHEGRATGKFFDYLVPREDWSMVTKFDAEEIKDCTVLVNREAEVNDGDLAVVRLASDGRLKLRRLHFIKRQDGQGYENRVILEDGDGNKTTVENVNELLVFGRVIRTSISV